MKKLSALSIVAAAMLFLPHAAAAQQVSNVTPRSSTAALSATQRNVTPAAQGVDDRLERAAKRFRVGVEGGVGLDPEIIALGAHVGFGPIFKPNLEVRPGVEFGFGEVTTLFGINIDVLYTFPGATRDQRWIPYIGGGPNFTLSHKSFETDDGEHISADGEEVDSRSRFDFSDTDFNGGFNFIAGARNQSGKFLEMKATAWGVANIRVLAGFNF